ncbi:midasin [Hypoxylon sp. NC1633]|nr:midasin [Hypoxylon sp. NC1633]
MAMIDISLQRKTFLDDAVSLHELPTDLLEIIRGNSSGNFLDAISTVALIPDATSTVFAHFESIFADICARWLLRPRNGGQEDRIIASFARILPFAPHLSVFLEQYIRETSLTRDLESRPFHINSLNSPDTPNASVADLISDLLSFWRLLNFEKKTFSQSVLPSKIQFLFKHHDASVRYLAIRVFCRQLDASDSKLEALTRQHIVEDEKEDAEFTFLSLFEHQNAETLDDLRRNIYAKSQVSKEERFPLQQLTRLVAQYNATIIPRPNGEPSLPSSLVHTPTTLANLENLAQNFQKQGPILLHGLPGSGKTSIVHELARELGMESSMVTLYLNEQTDAKMLIGLYSTGSKPGSFSWRPGVLTTAVREGRWVLIEDLDRAPNDVMSTLLPLVEHGKLLIPSRGETVEASSSFRLFATVRTTRGMRGQESLPSMLGQRFWHLSSVKVPPPVELEQIIIESYPLLHKYTTMIMSVYGRLCNISSIPSVTNTGRSTIERSITPRDILKWCRRLQETLMASGCKTGDEPISETTRDWMFMDAVDCFCGSLSRPDTRAALVSCIAEEMHLSKQLTEHYLRAHVPLIEETPGSFKVGRVMLTRRKYANRVVKSRKPFASTSHSRRLLEQISMAIKLREPVLLVGETGIGKTTVIQQLAESLGHKLVAVNLSQQSEVGDLLGGFKPVNARSLAIPLKEEFEDLFASTGISASKNQKYLEQIGKCIAKGQWTRVSKLWREAPKMFNRILSELQSQAEVRGDGDGDGRPAAKRRKIESRLQSLLDLRPRWESFAKNLEQFDVQISGGSGRFAFSFVEGNIVKAARNGDWVLLDEINLASPDTLESIADLLASGPSDEPSILLSETGEIERVKAHPDFRIFGAMNPATDIGKRDLPLGLRSRFTEFYVSSPDKDLKDLLTIIKVYLSGKSSKDEQAADDIARLYLNTKTRAEEKRLVDGANEVPHFSLRTLTRVLSYVNDVSPFYGLRRALFEGFSMGFLTLLDKASEETLLPLIHHHLLDRHGNSRSLLSQPPKHPNDGKQYVKFMNKNKDRQYWLLQGDETPMERADYIITPYIERNLLNLVRATSTRRFPILIQGPTSAGKTSMIEYLANFSGNKFVRINNHEHTDLQEYLGTYVSDSDGKLRFQEGLLVQALRQGHWIVLDELNLAPTDVLEALNRLLDDNRELLIPETQEVVRPHENFMLFATQNPPGLYGGRKLLSRAFRNRFLELHFDDIPEDELEIILQKRSLYTAPSDCKRIVNVYKELSRLRQTSRLFENKDSFATLRDLFRWALRGAETRDEIAANGFMLLAERVRNEEERMAVKKVIETVFKVKINQHQLYDIRRSPYLRAQPPNNGQGVVWTHAMRRLYPVLLVGETGCGKTTVCQLLAEALGKELHIVNAHQNTETGDLIGSQRPIRNRGAQLGQAAEGSLEILLERYHALDPSTLSMVPVHLQRRISDNEVKGKALFEWADGSLVHAMRDGQFFLLDEISLADDSPQRSLLLAEKGIDDSFVKASDGFQFLATMNPGGDFGKKELSPALRNRFTEIWVPALSENEDVLQIVSSKLRPEFQSASKIIVEFSYWFGQNFRSTASTAFSIRDILVWVKFVNESAGREPMSSVIHGAATVFIDTLGANPSALIAIDAKSMDSQRQKCLDKLSELLELIVKPDELRIGDFSIARVANESFESGFALHAPTTKLNAMRIIRALQVQKPVLLEGSPGVGKTTLVSALARAYLMDLFGTDVPVEGAEAAMQNGEWVLLDEMNLASQSVLEGLNACLDHRGEVYVSELDQVFKRHPDFRLFAAQNPHHQGGGRKGLPSSFEDLLLIAQHNFPTIPADTVQRMINFIFNLETRILVERAFGSQGSPWEFNLRDTLRWLHLLTSSDPLLSTGKVDDFLNIAIRQRFRTQRDKLEIDNLFTETFGEPPRIHQLYHNMCSSSLQVGLALVQRNQLVQPLRFPDMHVQNIPCILVGSSGSGKSMILQHVAASTDTMDLVGGFEQSDPLREINTALRELEDALQLSTMSALVGGVPDSAKADGDLLDHIENLLGQISADTELATILSKVSTLLQRPIGISNPRFEWLDGIIVQALQKGHWLVLDNANLCSASVLDRLNSLLEPDGYLIINEHCGPNGEPRIVRPHPDFRVFLTVDPRYGELSRAMRNRAIEIYIEPHDSAASASWRGRVGEVESSLQRYGLLYSALAADNQNTTSLSSVALDCISFTDVLLLEKYMEFDKWPWRAAMPGRGDVVARRDQLVQAICSSRKPSVMGDIQNSIRQLYVELPTDVAPGIDSMQPLHPLQNSVTVPLLQRLSPQLPLWLATCYELSLDIFHARELVKYQDDNLNSGVRVAQMNRFQRSRVAGRVAAVSKDTTIRAADFLVDVLEVLDLFIRSQLSTPGSWKDRKYLCRYIMHCWLNMFEYLTVSPFDETSFRAYLDVVLDDLFNRPTSAGDDQTLELTSRILGGLDDCFASGFKLSTGLSMNTLWKLLRPVPIGNKSLFDRVCRMEQLASQFDLAKWQSSATHTDLTKIMDSFTKAYQLIRLGESNAEDLLQVLKVEMDQLLNRLSENDVQTPPFMTAEFETMRQIVLLNCLSRQVELPQALSEVCLLSGNPLVSQMRVSSASDSSKLLLSMENLSGDYGERQHWDECLSGRILSKLEAVNVAPLNSLVSLEAELPTLATQVCSNTEAIVADRYDKLTEVLCLLMTDVVTIEDPSLANAFITAQNASETILARSDAIALSAQGLHFDIDELIPDPMMQNWVKSSQVVSDHLIPALASWIGSLGSANRRAYLANSWIQFSVALIKLFVPDKTHDPQLRPQVELASYNTLLGRLQNQLLTITTFEKFQTGQSTNLRCELLEEEIAALGPSPGAAEAVYRPADSELPNIQMEFNSLLGIILKSDISSVLLQHCSGSEAATQQLQVIHQNVSNIGFRLKQKFRAYEDLVLPVVNMIHCLELGLYLGQDARLQTEGDVPSETLLSLAPFLGGKLGATATRSTEDYSFEFLQYTSTIVAVEGPSGLETVKQDAFRAIHSLYNQWAQKLETDQKNEEAKKSWYRYRAGQNEEEAAEQEAFDELPPPKKPAIGDARALAIRLAGIHRDIFLAPRDASKSITDLNKMLSRIASANGDPTAADRNMLPATLLALDGNYNFYTDGNHSEVQKLVSLVNDIRARFRQLQGVDEIGHLQPLADIVSSCDKVLQLGHSDPLAQMIPKIEQLHAFVYEWQFGGWASKAYDLLVSWRRLELSTEEDANSWWFIAYQAIVAVPLNLAQAGDDISQHTSSLLKELESYFSLAPVGQFQLQLLSIDYPSISTVRDGLQNFISYYSRYTKAVDDRIRSDVFLLASWKDTNIVALRESARKSHQKLFRIVRKFREVLGQPMKPIIEGGLPDEVVDANCVGEVQATATQIDQDAIKLCSTSIPGWSDDYRRLANIQRTTEIMGKLSRIPETALNASEAINSFLSNLESSALELRKETPGVLNDENKALVKHLKSRKRKLFAETLKEARQMGIQYNLSLDVLSRQDALSTVLATSEAFVSQSSAELKSTDYYFHKMLDLSPRVRGASQDHSDDLTAAEIDRSIGLLEGILHITLGQRYELARALKGYSALSTCRDNVKAKTIIKVGIHLVEIHGKLGKVNNEEVLGLLKTCSLPTLPDGLTSLDRSHKELDDACQQWPALAFLLEQIKLWTVIDEQSTSDSAFATKEVNSLLEAAKNLCDGILVAIAKFNKTVAQLPASQEETGWLVKHSEIMAASLKALHMDRIEKCIKDTVKILAQVNLADASINNISTALMAVITPISIEAFISSHKSTCRLGYRLSKAFTQLASQGFCTPQEKSDETSNENGQLESGTGLGEGEGAEDISKDIQPDEDLSELAQERNKESDQDIEDEKDAVDMADQELEGDLESVDGGDDEEKGSKSGDEDESGDEMDEEAGEVDDLDPSADAEKDQQGENTKGQMKKDEQVAADTQPEAQEVEPGEDDNQGDENLDEDPAAEEDEQVQPQDETNLQDQNVQEQDTLALPDDMNIDGNDDESMSSLSDDELDKLSDVDQQEQNEKRLSDQESENGEDAEMEMAPEDVGNDDEELEETPENDDEDKSKLQEDEQAAEEPENTEEDHEMAEFDVKGAQREDGEMAGKKGSISTAQEQSSRTELDDMRDSSTHHPFKALGDALEKWHRQQQDIKEAQEQEPREQTNAEQESAIREFQHIQNDESAADAQAMGTANEELKQQIDESMAIDEEDQPADSRVLPEDETELDKIDGDKMDTSEPLDHRDHQDATKEERPTGVSTHQADGTAASEEVEEEIQETSTQLGFEEAMQQWSSFQSKTHPLSLSLTSQLRLILTPSQSTKLSGSYRTGKRLNIKRIIPYIASSYKRDKIWMRRAIPTKRKSMGESSSGVLALESLVMIGILGFGANVFTAHEFAEPFASHDAGAKALQKFTFQQDHTDIELLVRQTIDRFRLARLQSTARGAEDLWQLALILSDGLTPSSAHDRIRLLLREAMEERIMIVFIIMDDTATTTTTTTSNGSSNGIGSGDRQQKQSVINLKKVRFLGNDEIRTEYYLDSFPFQYYLIVHNLEDLPGALAGLLRTWFAEVNS